MVSRATCIVLLSLCSCAPDASAENATTLYLLHCSGCHGTDGARSKVGRIPPFPGFIGPIARATNGRTYVVLVPGVENAALSDSDTAGVLNFVLGNWSGEQGGIPLFSTEEVRGIRAKKIDDIAAMRREIAAELGRQGVSIGY